MRKWMGMGAKILEALLEIGFSRFVQSVEITKEKEPEKKSVENISKRNKPS